MKHINLLLGTVLVLAGLIGTVSLGRVYALSETSYVSMSADATSDVCAGVGLVSPVGSNGCSGNGTQVNQVIGVVINLFSAVVGVIAIVMIIVAGLKFITSGGNPQSVAGARNTLLYAIIGLVLVALAQVIVHFVLNQV